MAKPWSSLLLLFLAVISWIGGCTDGTATLGDSTTTGNGTFYGTYDATLKVPGNVQCSLVTDGVVRIYWTSVDAAHPLYALYKATAADGPYAFAGTMVSPDTWTLDNLDPSVKYYFKVSFLQVRNGTTYESSKSSPCSITPAI